VTPDEQVPQIALVSQCNAENRHKNTILLKPRNFYIPFNLHGDRMAILVWENFKKKFSYQQSSRALGFWHGHGRCRLYAFCTLTGQFKPQNAQAIRILHSHWSIKPPVMRQQQLSVSVCLAMSTPKAQRMGRSLIAECFCNFLRPELPFNHCEGWMGCRNYVALWIWCFHGDSLCCVVIRELFAR